MLSRNITYTENKVFTKEQVQALFLSINWVSGEYPNRLFKPEFYS